MIIGTLSAIDRNQCPPSIGTGVRRGGVRADGIARAGEHDLGSMVSRPPHGGVLGFGRVPAGAPALWRESLILDGWNQRGANALIRRRMLLPWTLDQHSASSWKANSAPVGSPRRGPFSSCVSSRSTRHLSAEPYISEYEPAAGNRVHA